MVFSRYPEGTSELAGMVLTATFRMAGQTFIGLNGGPIFKFTEAVSFSIDCESQQEIDYYRNRLIEGGEESMCGWLKDKFGLSWQVVPTELGSWLYHPAPEQAERAMQALLKMKKIDIETLKLAVR
jgi:predicted 3-demethylubiquinone-9 3-methyltransferase (glyoxalase superfamily)